MATRITAPEEAFRSGMLYNAAWGVDQDPDAMYLDLVTEKVTSKQSYERLLTRDGFGTFQRRNPGQASPIQEERVAMKIVRALRYALGYEIVIKDLEKDPNKLVAGKAPLLRASYIHTLNSMVQLAMLRGAAASNPIVSTVDGKAIFATDHTLKDGRTYSNKVAYSIVGASFLQAVSDLNTQLNREGMPVKNVKEWDVCCDPSKLGQIQTILESELFPGTNNNDTNKVNRRSFRQALAMKYWQLGGTSTANTVIFNPVEAKERPFFMMETEALTMEDQKAASVGKHGFYAWFEAVIEAGSHYNTLMFNS